MRRATHRTIQAVTDDIERWSFNTGVSHCQELYNALHRYERTEGGPHRDVFAEGADALCLLLAPMTPHVTAEIWDRRHPGQPSVHEQRWPSFDPDLVRERSVTMVVQVNGKVRDRLEVDPGIGEDEARALALASDRVRESVGEATITRVIVRPPTLVNVVT